MAETGRNFANAGGLIIAAPSSGSGKTIVTLGLIAALKARGENIAIAKTGPDYIDTAFLALAAKAKAINLDPWAMSRKRLMASACTHSEGADLLLIEGVMGLFDGAASGEGSTADLSATLGLPVVLVVDAARQSQSVAALVSGFVNWRENVTIAALILNNVASPRHEKLLRDALKSLDIPIVGCLPRQRDLTVPDRHLGLVLPGELSEFSMLVARAGHWISENCRLDKLIELAQPLKPGKTAQKLPPLGQHIAIAHDLAFSFIYQHWLEDWRKSGASVSFFSPLADETPAIEADAIFLPGGYPELHAEKLANANNFLAALVAARDKGTLIYGECGGYMVLGQTLVDQQGRAHKMAGLLPHTTYIDRPKRVLGYRKLRHNSPLPWPQQLAGHEFHYSRSTGSGDNSLFDASDALGTRLPPMGEVIGLVVGSYAHVIDVAPNAQSGKF